MNNLSNQPRFKDSKTGEISTDLWSLLNKKINSQESQPQQQQPQQPEENQPVKPELTLKQQLEEEDYPNRHKVLEFRKKPQVRQKSQEVLDWEAKIDRMILESQELSKTLTD